MAALVIPGRDLGCGDENAEPDSSTRNVDTKKWAFYGLSVAIH